MNLTDALFSLVKKPSSLTEMLFYKKIMGDGGGSELPDEYVEVNGFSMNNDCYFEITDFYLTGADTLKFSFSMTATCNVIGSYSGSATGNNYSLYATTSSTGKYLRYKSGAYNSYADTDKVYNVVISPTGTQGMETDSTWSQQDFTCTEEFYIGTTSPTSTSAKLKGSLYGNIEVVGRLKLIPCQRISDGVYGYYDVVGKVFYEPAVGTPTEILTDVSNQAWYFNESLTEDRVLKGSSSLAYDVAFDYIDMSTQARTSCDGLAFTDSSQPVGMYYKLAGGTPKAAWANNKWWRSRLIQFGSSASISLGLYKWLCKNATNLPTNLRDTKWAFNRTLDLVNAPQSVDLIVNGSISVLDESQQSYSRYTITKFKFENGEFLFYYSKYSEYYPEYNTTDGWLDKLYLDRIIFGNPTTGFDDATNVCLIAWVVNNATPIE